MEFSYVRCQHHLFDTVDAGELDHLREKLLGDGNAYILPQDLKAKCQANGSVELTKLITASHPTDNTLASAMDRDGFIRADAFCTWCVEETRFNELKDYLLQALGTGGVKVLERQSEFTRPRRRKLEVVLYMF
ncbi:unnamed protein product [Phytophthora fragariaefolia]|uniref:Unnamed protein product n=1 Tax=Phytophthora fragariaefolia TaxID=1490495 RepID=A0A9W6YJK9_9STRA|nr:unnamed protein product [Phytophthora fragariaefolia]